MTGPVRVEVTVDESITDEVPVELVAGAAQAALDAEQPGGSEAVTVLVTSDDKIRELHREFMDDDTVTDVLSFNTQEGWVDGQPPKAESGPVFPGEFSPYLGDIAISLPQVKRQATQAGHQWERELAMLTIHGVLHLLGYDHAEPDEEKRMFGKTDAILEPVMKSWQASQ